MAKGKGKKGKKKGKKKKEEKPEGALTEVDKTFYELTITDLNRKLARLRSKNLELEEKVESLNEELSKLDEDRNDVITYLKRILEDRAEEINELQMGIKKLQEALEQDKDEFEEKIKHLEEEYRQMHEQLTSEIKLLEGKLNALEEFRLQREELMKKFEIQEEQMEEQEARHKRAIYEIERKFIIAKDKLKKEMETRLLQLSTEFQDATEIRIAATTHRVIRENIAINNELDEMLNVHKRLYTENQDMQQKDKTLRHQSQLHCIEKNKALSKVKIQTKIIEQLTEEHRQMAEKLENYKNMELKLHDSCDKQYEANLRVQSLENKIRILEQNIHATKCSLSLSETNSAYYQAEAARLEDVILEAVGSIKESMKVQKAQKITDKALLATKREHLLHQLFKLMMSAKDVKIRKPSLPSVSSVENLYKKGDLGFVPAAIKSVRPPLRSIRTMQSQTGTSLVDESGEEENKSLLSANGLSDTRPEEGSHEEEKSEESVLFFDEKESTEEEEVLPVVEGEDVDDKEGSISSLQKLSDLQQITKSDSKSLKSGSKSSVQ